jgi:hypothetical protein
MKEKIKKVYLLLITLILLISNGLAQESNFNWKIGEELTYRVSYAFIRLGTLKLQILDSYTKDSLLVYKTRLYIDSNPMVFFVDMHGIYNVDIDEKIRPVLYTFEEQDEDKKYTATYQFSYCDSVLIVNYRSENDSIHKPFTKNDKLPEKFYDGLSLVFFARANVSQTRFDTLTTFIHDNNGPVSINFSGKDEPLEIDALEQEIKALYLDGVIHVEGIAGVTGPYKGWFSTDAQHVPLRAEMDVFIGSVVLELESWKNWSPKIN